jgi:hypothetical protein
MFDYITNGISNILAISIGGVTVATILGFIVWAIIKIKKEGISAKLIENSIETKIAEAIIPTKVRIDISGTVKTVLETDRAANKQMIKEQFKLQDQKLNIALLILSKFSHAEQLTDEQKIQLDKLLGGIQSTDIEV